MNRAIWAGLACISLAACGSGADSDAAADVAGDPAATTADGTATDAAAGDGQVTDTSGDALVPGTNYNAATRIDCGFGGAEPMEECEAGVIRNWSEDGTTLLEITKPDGRTRAIFFQGTEPYGADGSQADGSAGWELEVTRHADEMTIRFGPETYVVVEAFIVGG